LPTALEVDPNTNLSSPLLSSATTAASYSTVLAVLEEALRIIDEPGGLNGREDGTSDLLASNRSTDSNSGAQTHQSSSNDEHHQDWSQ